MNIARFMTKEEVAEITKAIAEGHTTFLFEQLGISSKEANKKMSESAFGWSQDDDQDYKSIPKPNAKLPADTYNISMGGDGTIFFHPTPFPSDTVLDLPGLPSTYVLKQIRAFWTKKDVYAKYGFLQKRGILFYGPPGCGKTSIIRMLCNDLIKEDDGVAFNISNFELGPKGVKHFRSVEPERPIMTVMEDIEGLFKGEAGPGEVQRALSFLDGQQQVNNIVHIATTNQPEELADRFIKRPGRFDLVIGIHAPAEETRRAYLKHVTNGQLDDERLEELTQKTEGLGLSYLRELASSWLCLGVPLDDSIKRLRANFESKGLRIKKESKVGFTIGYSEKE